MMYRKRKPISHFGQRLLLVLITLAILLLLALAGCAWWGYRVTSSGTSFPNMSLDGIPVGGRDMKTFCAIRDAYEAERRAECGLD